MKKPRGMSKKPGGSEAGKEPGEAAVATAPEPEAPAATKAEAAPAPVAPPLVLDAELPEPHDPLSEFFVRADERQGIELSFTAPGVAAARGSRDMLELLAFWVADEEYALPIVEIQEIIKLPPITEVPRTPRSVVGIISLRGTIVPVLDLRQVLRLDQSAATRQSRILVLRANGDPVGLLVDRVTSVVRLESESIEATPRAMQGQEAQLLRGVGRLGSRLIIVLDVAAVLGVMEAAA